MSKDLPRAREKDVATQEGMPRIVNVNDLHLQLVVLRLLPGLHPQVTALGATQGSSTLWRMRRTRAKVWSVNVSCSKKTGLCTLRSLSLTALLNGIIGKRLWTFQLKILLNSNLLHSSLSSISLNLSSNFVLPWCTFLPIFPMARSRSLAVAEARPCVI